MRRPLPAPQPVSAPGPTPPDARMCQTCRFNAAGYPGGCFDCLVPGRGYNPRGLVLPLWEQANG